MDSSKNSKAGLRKAGRSPGTRAGRSGRSGRSGRRQGMPRIMIAAGVLIVAGAVWLYWPAGESQPTGLGERRTVVSGEVAAAGSTATTAPVSGEVDIERQTQQITPEQPDESTTSAAQTELAAEAAEAREQATAASEPVAAAPEATKPAPKPETRTTTPPEPAITPVERGAYAVQVGSFGSADNADREVARLKALGWQPLVRAGNNSAGEMVFRVWIAWFSSRQDAQKFIAQNPKAVPGAIPVHR